MLDIKLPDISGLDVLKRLGDRPHVVFSTAYDTYAIEAFEVEAVDFLLKPYEQDLHNLNRMQRQRPILRLSYLFLRPCALR